MPTTKPKPGYRGGVYLGATKVAMATWNYSGETRNMQDVDEFEDETVVQLPLQRVGGDIEISGNYLLAEDAGQKLLQTYFDAATEITDIRLYTDKTNSIYLTPKSGSHCIVTKCNNVTNDKSGTGTLSATLHVNGELEQVGSTTAVSVASIGSIDAATTTITLLGELLSLGGESDVDCYFEYGTTTSYGEDTSASQTNMTATGMFDNDLTGLSGSTTYHYRAVALLGDTSKVYGQDKTFTTTS
jgi:hypothetical protein